MPVYGASLTNTRCVNGDAAQQRVLLLLLRLLTLTLMRRRDAERNAVVFAITSDRINKCVDYVARRV